MDVSLTAFARYSLTSLQPNQGATTSQTKAAPTSSLAAFSPDRLKTSGNAVSVLQSLSGLSSSLNGQKSQVDQSISLVRAGQSGATSAMTVLAKMKGLVQDARHQGAAGQAVDTKSFNDLAKQLNAAATSGGYQGLNLINDSTASLTVSFKSGNAPSINVAGSNLKASSVLSAAAQAGQAASNGVLGAMAAAAGATGSHGFSSLNAGTKAGQAVFDKLISQLDTAISRTQETAGRLGKSLGQLAAHPTTGLGASSLDSSGASQLSGQIGQQLGGYSGNLAGSQWQTLYGLLR